MAQPNSVKLVEICRVAPKPGAPDLLSLPLTYFDSLWLRFPPVQRLYFYELTSSSSSNSSTSADTVVLAYLKTSLSLTLKHFVPLAGNLTWPQDSHTPLLSYVQGDTVSLTVAESDADNFDHLSSNNVFLESKAYHPLVPQLESSHERTAAIALQITLFPGRAFAIGTAMHHAILAGKTYISFVKSWAHACSKKIEIGLSIGSDISLPEQLKPLYDRTVIYDPTGLGLESIYLNDWQNLDGPNNRSVKVWELNAPPDDSVRSIFEFTGAQIQTLRQMVLEKVSDPVHLHLSTFSLACAYTWVCLVKAQEIEAGKVSVQVVSVDCRSRLDPPVPENYFGNCMMGVMGFADAKELLGEDGLVAAVTAIGETIKGLDKNGVLKRAHELYFSKIKDLFQAEGIYATASSHRFQIYDTNFGWGRPKKVDVVSIDRTAGAISVSDSKNGGGGIEFGVVLKKDCMEAFASLFAVGFGKHRVRG
ncbi:putative isoflavone-7-O-beta-glucoside 6''-O-malonyltransferase [Rosa chinensis]|uniref:Putative isoflavone-7-O-beta-glucoside 6''-O-malonyltransferase n=1 Tax=Rosa chinensis TaxID=74649 RepID=A0A2P6S7W7_ROSCH|nr:phenolic glucoside malonyltransferase 1 [Rosa chinensis]PRQ54755.1 putative isoflavone-7-O-beta-glucoside 6''-O-malonyltransferase [Rosa chinensis]